MVKLNKIVIKRSAKTKEDVLKQVTSYHATKGSTMKRCLMMDAAMELMRRTEEPCYDEIMNFIYDFGHLKAQWAVTHELHYFSDTNVRLAVARLREVFTDSRTRVLIKEAKLSVSPFGAAPKIKKVCLSRSEIKELLRDTEEIWLKERESVKFWEAWETCGLAILGCRPVELSSIRYKDWLGEKVRYFKAKQSVNNSIEPMMITVPGRFRSMAKQLRSGGYLFHERKTPAEGLITGRVSRFLRNGYYFLTPKDLRASKAKRVYNNMKKKFGKHVALRIVAQKGGWSSEEVVGRHYVRRM